MATPGHSTLFFSLLVPAAVMTVTWIGVHHLDQSGSRFFDTGRQIVDTLDRMAHAAKLSDWELFGECFAHDYQGEELGLGRPSASKARDGVEQFAFHSSHTPAGRSAAIAEWMSYRGSFESIQAFELHLDNLESWSDGGAIRATARVEVIATLRGAAQAGIDRANLAVEFERGADGLRIRKMGLRDGERIEAVRPLFQNVAHDAGIEFVNRYYPPFLDTRLKFGMIRYGPAGITAADYDGDGLYDLFIPDGVESKLFRNLGNGSFEDVTARAGLAGLDGVSVALFADYDNDGYKDLFVSRTFRHNQLFHNNGDGTFTDVTAKSGLGDDCCTTVASWGDYNNDGLLDLYVGRYLDPRKDIPTTFYARNGEPNQLYRNNGDGTFTNVTAQAKVGDTGLCLGTVFGDYDGDGYPDLYVVNDFGRKTLYHNRRDGTFEDVTVKSGTLAYGAGMSASFGDFNNDGRLDIYVTNIRSEHAWYASSPTVAMYMLNSWREGVWKSDMPLYWQIFRQSGFDFVRVFRQMASGNNLLRNRGDGTFEDVTAKAGANPVGWFWGASFADFDNDGWQDIYAADGWVYNEPDTEIELEFLNNVVTHQDVYKTGLYFDPKYFGNRSWHGYERNRYLRNNGDGTFSEIGRAVGADLMINSRGVAVADFWNRGVMDIAVSSSGGRNALLKNQPANRRNWLQVELVGTKSTRDAVGARVVIQAGGKMQMREVVLGDGYGSQNSLRQHFGLDNVAVVDQLEVRWPRTGTVQTFRNVAANVIVEITEGKDLLVEKHYKSLSAQ